MRALVGSLIGLGGGLLLVGIVSGTPIRHVVQVAPAAIVLALAISRSRLAGAAALAICVVWLTLMAAIWSFLLGWPSFVSGTFPPIEIVLTVVIGASSLVGAVSSIRRREAGAVLGPALVFACSLGGQLLAIWISIRPGIARI